MSGNYFIGSSDEVEKYKENNGKINLLPLKNLPVVYYPIKGTDSYDIKNNIKRISSDENNNDKINKIDLNNLLSKLESKDEAYNNNNIIMIMIILIIIWIIIILFILKVIYILMEKNYTTFIIVLITILLVLSIVYSLFITGKYF
jgi:ATP-dependent Zn protease